MFQPAIQQRRKRVEGLIAVGQQSELAVVLGKQGGKAGNAQIARPIEVGGSGITNGLGIEAICELTACNASRLGQFDELRWQSDVSPLDVKRSLNQPEERPGSFRLEATRRNQCATGRLGVVDQPVRQTRLEVEPLASWTARQ